MNTTIFEEITTNELMQIEGGKDLKTIINDFYTSYVDGYKAGR